MTLWVDGQEVIPLEYYIDDSYVHVKLPFYEWYQANSFNFEVFVVEPPAIESIEPLGPSFYDPEYYDGYYHPGSVITIVGNKLQLDESSTITIDGLPIGPVVYNDESKIVVVLPRGVQPGELIITTSEGESAPFNISNIGERIPNEYANEITCVSWGDPHFTKFNGEVFHFQGYGEYLLATDEDVEVQTRQIPCGAGVTCNTAVAVKYGNTYFAVHSNQVQLTTYVNHTVREIKVPETELAPDFIVERISRNEYVIHTPFIRVRAIFTPWVDVYVTALYQNLVSPKGLCGGPNREWVFGNDTTIPAQPTQEFINAYGESWRVTPATSIFDYPPEQDYDDYNHPEFEHNDNPVLNNTEAANLCSVIAHMIDGSFASDCSNVPQVGYYYYACLQDAVVTGNYSSVESTIAAFTVQCNDAKNGDLGGTPLLGSRSTASGPGVQRNGVAAGVWTSFVINPKDGRDSTYEGPLTPDTFAVTFSGQTVTSDVYVDYSANTIVVNYVAPTVGDITISVVYTNHSASIVGSPFTVTVGSKISCVSWGDPHFTTYGGVAYDFQGFGEYVLTNANGVEVQVRQEPCGDRVTCNYAIAAKYESSVIALYSKNNVIKSYIDNVEFTPNSTTALIRKASSYEYQFIFPNRFEISIRNYGRLDITATMTTTAADFATSLVGGLCGSYHKNWQFSNNTQYNFASTPITSPFLNSYGQSWQVNSTQSLFNYSVTDSNYEAQNPTDYEPNDDVVPIPHHPCEELTTELFQECYEYVDPEPYISSCQFDVTATGNNSLASSSIVAYATICSTIIGNIKEYPTVAAHSYAEGAGIAPTGITPLESIGFTIYAIDAIGNPQVHGKTDEISIYLVQTPSGNLSEISFNHTQFNSSNRYDVIYTGRRPGVTVIAILINGEHISGSPFAIEFGPFIPSVSHTDAYGSGVGHEGGSYEFFETYFVITARNRINELTTGATFNISSDSVETFHQTDNNDGTYLVKYITPAAGTISVSITYGGQHIIGSPFPVAIKDLKSTVTCVSWGDPHFTMFGGRVFNFQGYGEYILAKIGGLEVQVRQKSCTPGAKVTCNFAIVGREADTTLAIYLDDDKVLSAHVNGSRTTTFSPSTITRTSTYQYKLNFPSAIVEVRSYSTRLDFTVVANCNGTYPENPMHGGLCGQWNAFLPLANGTVFSEKITQKHIDAFGESWRVPNSEESFFDYTNTSFDNLNPTDFVPNYNQTTDNQQIKDDVVRVCSELAANSTMVQACKDYVEPTPFYEACEFDVIASTKGFEGQASIVTYAALCQHAASNSSTDPPIVNFPAIAEHTYADGPGLNATGQIVGRDTYFVVRVVDALGRPSNVTGINVTSTGNIPTNLHFDIQETGETGVYNVTYTPGQPSTHLITVVLVGSNLEISGSPFEISIVQPCELEPCGSGYTCDGVNCIDINECLTTDCGAGHKCVNLEGSYYCKNLTCPGNCNGNGVCLEGTCVCNNPFTGPGCEATSVQLVLTFNQNYPSVKIDASGKTFEISITEIRELNTQNEVVARVEIPPLKFAYDNIGKTWNYTLTPLVSSHAGSSLSVTFTHHEEPFEIQFAGLNVSRPANTLKMAATVANWQFLGIRNRLALVSKSNVVQNQDACFLPNEVVYDPNGNLIWVKDEIEAVTLYGQFLQNAVVDGRNRQMSNQFDDSNSETLLILPHFFSSASLDPDFSVLLDPLPPAKQTNPNAGDECSDALEDDDNDRNIVIPIVATICSVIGVAMIVVS